MQKKIMNHTCCCLESGCAASYKARACADDPKNGTDKEDATTSVTDVSAEGSTISETTNPSTESHTVPESKEVSATTLADALTKELETLSATSEEEENEETTTVAKRDTTYAAVSTTMDELPTSSEAMFTSTTTERRTTPLSTSTRTTTTRKETTTSRTTQAVTTPSRTTTVYTPRTTRYTTTQVPRETTTTRIEELRLLPDVAHAQQQTEPAQQRITERKQLTTTSMGTTTHATTTSVRTAPPMREEPVVEQIREMEPAKSERAQFISPPVRSETVQKPEEQAAEPSEVDNTTQANGEKVATSSLISVYEVTTLAVKNKEVQQQWKPPVPWWGAAAMGFLVSVIAAWAVVFFLRK
ncbi:hypothetical protein ANCCAN_07810 [Ancylostoma caninum]|uniref:Uncharacterized protein n=1 Tax=Ancylostoma caninum TaxID=29170 RepID=A0A368GP51_ANCCA|nr:hypothetical protein ANCCAN_07810 [Ancylostoma caninum]